MTKRVRGGRYPLTRDQKIRIILHGYWGKQREIAIMGLLKNPDTLERLLAAKISMFRRSRS